MGPAACAVGGEVQQAGDADDGADVFGGPVHDRGEVAAVGEQAGFDGFLEVQHGVVGVGGEGEDGGVGPVGEGEDERAQGGGVGVDDGLGRRWAADPAAPDGGGGQGVEDAGEQSAAAEAGHGGDVGEHFGLHGQAEGEGGVLDVFGGRGLCGRR